MEAVHTNCGDVNEKPRDVFGGCTSGQKEVEGRSSENFELIIVLHSFIVPHNY